MFKYSSIFLTFFSLISALSFADEDLSQYYDKVPVIKDTPSILSAESIKLPNYRTFHERILQNCIDYILLAMKVGKAVNDVSVVNVLARVMGLISVFGVENTKYVKLSKAVEQNHLNKALRCINMGMTKNDITDLVGSPDIIDATIKKLKEKINKLEDVHLFIKINEALASETSCQKAKNIVQAKRLESLNLRIIADYDKIEQKELLLKKLREKNWQDAEDLIGISKSDS